MPQQLRCRACGLGSAQGQSRDTPKFALSGSFRFQLAAVISVLVARSERQLSFGQRTCAADGPHQNPRTTLLARTIIVS